MVPLTIDPQPLSAYGRRGFYMVLSRGTGSLKTPRWREEDSNCRSHFRANTRAERYRTGITW
jgi:hypothetical protein